MGPEELRFLLSAEGQAVLAELAATPVSEGTHMAVAARLRAQLGPERGRAALDTALLRQRAARKFSRAAAMVFTRDGLEQATAEPIAAHRAARFAAAGVTTVADLGCGIGGDALALAGAGAAVLAIDRDRLRLLMAAANAAVYDVAGRLALAQADLLTLPPARVEAFFFDPARRAGGGPREAPSRRLRAVADYQPPLSLIDAWRPVVPRGAVKVAPGIEDAEVPAGVEVEIVSLGGEVKEAVLWYGELRTAARRATLLPGGQTLSGEADVAGAAPVATPRAYLYEPDGAVIRAHLVGLLAAQLDATLLDPHIAYLTTGAPRPTPFARLFAIDDAFPFQLKRLRAALRARRVGRVTIKKRGSPLEPEALRQALRLRGPNEAIVFLTQVMGRHTVLIGRSLA
ncbi:MAG TPA: SAM-dependent methyltransferase [Promineifilum sp.]|nr:SAM-dependent methyltransferase [Promineifilum sp.]